MIDFQNNGLESQVFEAIAKLCNLNGSDEFPHFQTTQYKNGKWKCEIKVPGIEFPTSGFGRTEVESINRCAAVLLYHLKKIHDKDQFNPEFEDSIFRGNIEQFFTKKKYDTRYRYHLCETDILLEPDKVYKMFLENGSRTLQTMARDEEEIDSVSEIVTIRLLVKTKKKNFA